MTDHRRTEVCYVNTLEPLALINHFYRQPPTGFTVHLSPQGLPYFSTQFDLLTTADDKLREKLPRWPGYRLWRRWLKIDTYFIGTTVNEYSPFPAKVAPAEMVEWIQKNCARAKKLTIIKDLPNHSPLLTAKDNHYSQALTEACLKRGFIRVEGQALAYVPINFNDIDEYLARLSHSRRRNIRRKLRSRQQLRLEVLNTGDAIFHDKGWRLRLYQLYMQVYNQSEIHFDRLSEEFFAQLLLDADSGGRVFCYWHDDELIGFNICYQHDDKLIDKYIGLNYPQALHFNLYVVSWFINLEYALENGLRFYVAGWTDPEVKADLGAQFTLTTHLVWVRNPLLRRCLMHFRHHFESDAQWHQERLP